MITIPPVPKPKKPSGKIDMSGFAYPKPSSKKSRKKSNESESAYPKPRRIRSQSTIDKSRKPLCEVCGSPAHGEPHHIVPRSLLGSDVKENLIQLCHRCHYVDVANGTLTKEQLFPIVAKREKVPADELRRKLASLMNREWV